MAEQWYGSGEPHVQKELAPVPAAPIWVSTHFDSLPIEGWLKYVQAFHANYSNQSIDGPVTPYPRPGEYQDARNMAHRLFARAIAQGDENALESSLPALDTLKHMDRAGVLPLFGYQDNEGLKYVSLVMKGIGFVPGNGKNQRYTLSDAHPLGQGGEFGVHMIADANTQDLVIDRLGLRAPRTVCVFLIDPKDFDRKKVAALFDQHPSLRDGPHGRLPYLAIDVRAMRNPLRMTHVLEAENIDIARKNIELSARLLHHTDGVKDSPSVWYESVRKSLAGSAGKMGHALVVHKNLIDSNITLAAEILDFDSMQYIPNLQLSYSEGIAMQTFEALQILEYTLQLREIMMQAFGSEGVDTIAQSIDQFIVLFEKEVTQSSRREALSERMRNAMTDGDSLRELCGLFNQKKTIEKTFPNLLQYVTAPQA